MAFMMPVVKNDWDIYRSNRSRRSSECSNPARSRKVSECRSEGPSLSTSPGSDFLLGSPPHRSAPIALRHSRTSLPSPSKSSSSSSNNSSPPKSSCVGVTSGSGGVSGRTGSQSSLNKFHSRLVDKLRRSLKIKDALDASVSGVDSRAASS